MSDGKKNKAKRQVSVGCNRDGGLELSTPRISGRVILLSGPALHKRECKTDNSFSFVVPPSSDGVYAIDAYRGCDTERSYFENWLAQDFHKHKENEVVSQIHINKCLCGTARGTFWSFS